MKEVWLTGLLVLYICTILSKQGTFQQFENNRKNYCSERNICELDCPEVKNITTTERSKQFLNNQSVNYSVAFPALYNLSSFINKNCNNYKRNGSSNLFLPNVLGRINQITEDNKWEKMEEGQRTDAASLLMYSLESSIEMAVVNMDMEKYNLTMDSLGLQVKILRNKVTRVNGTVTLLAKQNQMEFHWETKESKYNYEFAAVSFVVCTKMGALLNVKELEMENKKFGKEHLELNSNLLMAIMTTSNQRLDNVTFIIKNKEVDDVDDYTVCVFLRKSQGRVFWSTTGCEKMSSNHSHTLCNCRHLSNFAVLVALYKVEGPALTIITYIGLMISLVALLTAIITFIMCRAIQSSRTTIHTHLCLCLFLAELLFLIGISKTENKGVCAAIAGVLHYLFLASFMWMLLEGFQLYLMVIKVFQAQSLHGKYTYPIAYGTPALIVILSAAVYPEGYGTREHCWLTMEKGFRWSFVAPMCIIFLVNLIFLIVTIWKLIQKFHSLSPDLTVLQKVRVFVITAIAQLVFLGSAWIFGVFHFQRRTIALAYIFTILNSFQGTFIFILHCVINKQVRSEYRVWFVNVCNFLKVSKYSSFADSFQPSSSSQVGTSATYE
ncbi:adhesion G protein-coupled receptor E5-like isoform X2 [Hemitrygon akajei]|uniref:adhesion G protein-coupled receptor E5-like isoform X2 n=1 Tax=Hemitrygon akajei TaxID=2704970 RepID=UPI003BF95BD8